MRVSSVDFTIPLTLTRAAFNKLKLNFSSLFLEQYFALAFGNHKLTCADKNDKMWKCQLTIFGNVYDYVLIIITNLLLTELCEPVTTAGERNVRKDVIHFHITSGYYEDITRVLKFQDPS